MFNNVGLACEREDIKTSTDILCSLNSVHKRLCYLNVNGSRIGRRNCHAIYAFLILREYPSFERNLLSRKGNKKP